METQVPVSDLSADIFGKMFADKGEISHQLDSCPISAVRLVNWF
ncbi:hypothetical protein NEOC65_000084 [Neochlamydia sp. AcF65]|nr:hypothetical protein [Neochlamydia sp. AcF65]